MKEPLTILLLLMTSAKLPGECLACVHLPLKQTPPAFRQTRKHKDIRCAKAANRVAPNVFCAIAIVIGTLSILYWLGMA